MANLPPWGIHTNIKRIPKSAARFTKLKLHATSPCDCLLNSHMKGRSQEKNFDHWRFYVSLRLRHRRETHRYSFLFRLYSVPALRLSVSLTLSFLYLLPSSLLPIFTSRSSRRRGRRSVLRYPAWWRWQAPRGEHCNWYVLIMLSDKTWPDHARLNGGQLSRRRPAQSCREANWRAGETSASMWQSLGGFTCAVVRVLRDVSHPQSLFFLLFLFYTWQCRLIQTLMTLSPLQLSPLTQTIKFQL